MICLRLSGAPFRAVAVVCSLFVGALGVSATQAAVVVLEPAKDTSLYEDNGAASNGSGETLYSGLTGCCGVRRALIGFDVAGSVPAGSTINSASIQLEVTKQGPGSATQTYVLRRMLADWGEAGSAAPAGFGGTGAPAQPGDATWTHSNWNTTPWATLGGDFDTGFGGSASTGVTGLGPHNWSSTTLRNDVQAFLDNPASNFGWILIGNEATAFAAREFGARENLVAGRRPQLTIDFTPPASTSAGRIPDGSASGTPLLLSKPGLGSLQLSWDASCLVGDTDYQIYVGAPGPPFTAHFPMLCSTGGGTTFSFGQPAGSAYYLVVPHNGTAEGSYGLSSSGAERLASPAPCRTQDLGTCP